MGGNGEEINQGRSRPHHDLAHDLRHLGREVATEAGLEAPSSLVGWERGALPKAVADVVEALPYKVHPAADIILPEPTRWRLVRFLSGTGRVLGSPIFKWGTGIVGQLISALQSSPLNVGERAMVLEGRAREAEHDLARDLAAAGIDADARPPPRLGPPDLGPEWGLEVTRSPRTPQPPPPAPEHTLRSTAR